MSSASRVIARAGTLNRFSTPSCLIVIPSREIPNKAREPSMVAVFIDSRRPATRQTIITLPSASPTIVSNAWV